MNVNIFSAVFVEKKHLKRKIISKVKKNTSIKREKKFLYLNNKIFKRKKTSKNK